MPAKVTWNGRAFLEHVIANVQDGVDEGAILMQREVKAILTRYSSLGGRKASTPAKALGLDSGTLNRSIQIDRRNIGDRAQPRAKVGSNLVYAAIHEFGGVAGHGARIPKRPYMRPALANARSKVVSAIDAAIIRAIGSFKGVR